MGWWMCSRRCDGRTQRRRSPVVTRSREVAKKIETTFASSRLRVNKETGGAVTIPPILSSTSEKSCQRHRDSRGQPPDSRAQSLTLRYQPPDSGCQSLTLRHQPPDSGCQSLTLRHQPPDSGDQPPDSGGQPLTLRHQPLDSGDQPRDSRGPFPRVAYPSPTAYPVANSGAHYASREGERVWPTE